VYLFEFIVAAISATAWTYLLFAHGSFWRVRQKLIPGAPASQTSAVVAAVIPARNEADVIGRSIASLLRQSGPHSLHVFLVDDGSSDGTAEAARQAALSCNRDGSLTVMPGRPLAKGWSGKVWAMSQGIEAARVINPDFLLLTDADIEHAPDNISSLIGVAESGPYDLTSIMVKLHCRSFAEKLLIPAFVYFFFKIYPPSWIANPGRQTAGAAGGCMLIRPAALARAGGVRSICGEIIDDCALARKIKDSNGRVWLGMSDATVSLRPYGSFTEMNRMISRTAFNQLRHSALSLLGTAVGLGVVYVAPPALLGSGRFWPTAVGLLAYVLMVASYLPIVGLYDLNPAWGFTLPFSALFYMAATIRSALNYWTGRGGQWKDRAQDVRGGFTSSSR